MRIPFFQIDTFTTRKFGGNPAVVCVLESWLDDAVLADIAAEHNVSTTAFVLPTREAVEIRYALPGLLIPFAGHATLAAAYVCHDLLGGNDEPIRFRFGSGELIAAKRGDGRVAFERGVTDTTEMGSFDAMARALGRQPVACRQSAGQYFAIYDSEEDVRNLVPDMNIIMELDRDSIVVTAPSDHCDFVSRAFAPKEGLPEDPVCGSAHFALAPYWSAILGRKSLRALQLSRRGGELFCEVKDESVELSGRCVQYASGNIEI